MHFLLFEYTEQVFSRRGQFTYRTGTLTFISKLNYLISKFNSPARRISTKKKYTVLGLIARCSIPGWLNFQKLFSVTSPFSSQNIKLIILPNQYTNEIIKFCFIICTLPVSNSLFSGFPLFLGSLRIFSLKILFSLSRPSIIKLGQSKMKALEC